MKAKFKEFQFVEVSGTATGYGDLVGWIQSVELSGILGQPHYNVRVYSAHTDSVYVAEKFITEAERSVRMTDNPTNQNRDNEILGFSHVLKCKCEMPAKMHGKNLCYKCKRSLS